MLKDWRSSLRESRAVYKDCRSFFMKKSEDSNSKFACLSSLPKCICQRIFDKVSMALFLFEAKIPRLLVVLSDTAKASLRLRGSTLYLDSSLFWAHYSDSWKPFLSAKSEFVLESLVCKFLFYTTTAFEIYVSLLVLEIFSVIFINFFLSICWVFLQLFSFIFSIFEFFRNSLNFYLFRFAKIVSFY